MRIYFLALILIIFLLSELAGRDFIKAKILEFDGESRYKLIDIFDQKTYDLILDKGSTLNLQNESIIFINSDGLEGKSIIRESDIIDVKSIKGCKIRERMKHIDKKRAFFKGGNLLNHGGSGTHHSK